MTVKREVDGREFAERRARFVRSLGTDLVILFRPQSLAYLFGLVYWPSERPLALIIDGGEVEAFVPRLEEDAFRNEDSVQSVTAYDDYPGTQHPMQLLAQRLTTRCAASGRR